MRFSTNNCVVFAAMVLSALSVQSFQPIVAPSQRTGPLKVSSPPDQSEENTFVTETPTEPLSTPTIQEREPAPLTSPVAAATSALEARTMDEGIYGFNKKLIDTVYDIICFLYPVKGNARDFARFYVLETVARVPYFAYLSVMHLRETFGERYDSMSERCVRMNLDYTCVWNDGRSGSFVTTHMFSSVTSHRIHSSLFFSFCFYLFWSSFP